MLQEAHSSQARSYRKLQLPGQLTLLRSSCLERMEAEHERLQQFSRMILDASSTADGKLRFFRYGILNQRGQDGAILYATHQAGLFSCWTTILWTILEIQKLGLPLPDRISNRFGMDPFKNHLAANTIPQWFETPSPESLSQLAACQPLGKLLDAPHLFDHHGNYETLLSDQLGPDWLQAFLRTYMQPSRNLQKTIENMVRRYQITSKRTLVVCYRGTDKGSELQQDSVLKYLATAQQLVKNRDIDQVLIQTDQQQVRDLFVKTFAGYCVVIEELPVTRGQVVMHAHLAGQVDIEAWTLNLLAMVFACARACTVLTHTGNLGLFLDVMARLQGARVVQLR